MGHNKAKLGSVRPMHSFTEEGHLVLRGRPAKRTWKCCSVLLVFILMCDVAVFFAY